MRGFGWNMPVDIRFGSGVSQQIAADLGGRPCVVLAFDPAYELGLRNNWTRQRGPALLGWVPVPGGPATLAVARQLAQRLWPLLRSQPQAVLLGLGGGTVMDLAKWLCCRPREADFEALTAAPHDPSGRLAPAFIDLWLVPTAGSGKELKRWVALHDDVDR